MLKILKYAAIDIGSNAVRLLISSIVKETNKPPRFKKTSLVRVPIRLGADVFLKEEISEENTKRILDTMLAFKLLISTHRVDKYKACATSAMREATNGKEVVDLILEATGITIDIIEGVEEATIIAATDLNNFIDKNKTYLYVDVGGGSTEFCVIHNGEKIASKSFKVGTVRLLNDIVKKETWQELEQWVKFETKAFETIEVIGSGGNINNIFKSSGKASGKPLTYFYLTSYYNKLQSYSYEERITELNLNQDRADVIIPATRIYLSAMKWSRAKDIYVPKIGLADGIIKSIYFDTVQSNTQ
ncbi:MAG: rod shape-determining protein [Lacinutrix sp.]|uniref:Ppx/GppA phosphatase family protein n=1 Tax=Lacinutrix sp. TaxID=1937692 RepID=UPI0030AA9AB2